MRQRKTAKPAGPLTASVAQGVGYQLYMYMYILYIYIYIVSAHILYTFIGMGKVMWKVMWIFKGLRMCVYINIYDTL